MQFDMRELPMVTRYKIVNSTITPRPIAWITSQSVDGILNAAPYSFFNCVGTEPPLVVLGLLKEPASRGLKNTASNIIATGEFVVNLVCEGDAEKMNLCSVDAPADVSEIDYAGIETAPSVVVAPPRIASSPVSFECRKVAAMDIGAMQTVIIGEILMAHIKDEFITDRERVYFDTPAMKLIGRTHGSGWYVRNSDSFQMERPRYDPSRLAMKDKAAE
ncbi:flavin reductase family protein [Sphingobium sp. EM0848]|uniref:flavin reductase family protein n=1 Tax=Sphingobium sp. EM0848 TaxID=2743473 RepID=UPI00159C70EA|nr:flavin reductase family protein [Sphingobium sp. EM0848]